MTARTIKTSLTFLLLACIFASPVFGEHLADQTAGQGQQSGSITGTVMDPTGTPISGATVTLRGASLTRTRTGSTDADGEFRFDAVAPGSDYTLEVIQLGFGTQRTEGVIVVSGQTTTVRLDLTLAAVSESVVVSATRRETELMDTPMAITSLSSYELDEQAIIDVRRLSQAVPSMTYSSSAGTYDSVSIRGISSQIGGSSSMVTMYVDEVPVTDMVSGGTRQPGRGGLYDLERVEVLRGPQGTLFGEGSIGGTVRYITKDADLNDFEFNFRGTGEIASESEDPGGRVTAAVNVPILPGRLAVRFAGNYLNTKGVVDVAPPRDELDVDFRRQTAGRFKVNWLAADPLRITGMIEHRDSTNGAPGLVELPFATEVLTSARFPNGGSDDMTTANVTAHYDMDFAQFLSATSYFDRTASLTAEFLPSFVPFIFDPIVDAFLRNPAFPTYIPGLPDGPSLNSAGPETATLDRSERFTQDFRLVSRSPGNLVWTAGFYYSDTQGIVGAEDGGALGWLLIPNPGFEAVPDALAAIIPSTEDVSDITEVAGYGDVGYRINDQWDFSLGARISRNTTDLVTAGDRLEDTFLSPRAVVNYRRANGLLVYGSVSQGFRPGVNNAGVRRNLEGVEDFPVPVPGGDEFIAAFTPLVSSNGDSVVSYEVGVKTPLWNNRIDLATNVYYMDWQDFIAANSYIAPHTGGFGQYFDNVGEAHSTGLELETFMALSARWMFTFLAAVNSAKLDSVDVPVPGFGVGAPFEAGATLPNAPRYNFATTLEYRRPVGRWHISARGDYYRVAETFFDLSNEVGAEPFNNLEARFTLTDPRQLWSISVFAQNLTNDVVITGENIVGATYGPPRVIAFEFSIGRGGRWSLW